MVQNKIIDANMMILGEPISAAETITAEATSIFQAEIYVVLAMVVSSADIGLPNDHTIWN